MFMHTYVFNLRRLIRFMSIMSKILRAIVLSAYTALLIQYLKQTINSISKDNIEIEYVIKTPNTMKKLLKNLKKFGYNETLRQLEQNYKPPERLPTDLKYILKWTEAFSHYTSSIFGNGQAAFIQNKCEYSNCYITNDKSLLVDHRYFDAILFDVENNWDEHPYLRDPHQRFIFTASESASNYPICDPDYDSYYNLTWTYKLDSDIRWSYITILDKKGNVIGPAVNMTWLASMSPTLESVARRLFRKKRAAAWFVSNCKTTSKRETIAVKLSEALEKYKLKIDIYGWCGHLTCPKDRIEDCLDILEEDYFFYLSFENSLSEDYVTEKLLYPVNHYVVPIVYGGANYTRFLPPGSYLNAGELNATELAYQMNRAIKNYKIYQEYFRWRNHYEYKESPVVADVCTLCKILNNPETKSTVVKDFRKWWNPDHENVCMKDLKGHRMYRSKPSL